DRTRVAVVQDANGLTITSDAPADGNVLTDNESAVLLAILRRDELGVFYRPALRDQQLRQAAVAYGLEHEPDLERYFVPKLAEGRLVVQPRIPGLLPLSSTKLRALGSGATGCALPPGAVSIPEERVIVFSKHKYYRHIRVDVMHVGRTKAGRLKPPFVRLQPLDLIASATRVDEAKFYAAIAAIQQVAEGDRAASDLTALQAIVKYGGNYPFYCHDDAVG